MTGCLSGPRPGNSGFRSCPSENEIATAADARQLAEQIGYPVVLKPARKSRPFWVVRKDKDLETTLRLAQSEAKALLGDARVYLERYVEIARHLEVQFLVAGDQVVVLPERESSIQYRQEKIMCEALSPLVTPELRARMAKWTAQFAKAIGFRNAGTVDFLADEKGDVFLLNVQASLSREHAVTEVLLGCDLVAEQIRIAAGEPATSHQPPATTLPHVIQCRISAENPEQGWVPTSGIVTLLCLPGGPACAPTATFTPGTRAAPSTTHCWQESRSGIQTGRRRLPEWSAPCAKP